MATTTLFELVRDDLFAAFRSSAVATQAGVVAATWASTTLPYVEYGDGRPKHLNMGRLPHVEFFVANEDLNERTADGGETIIDVSIRVTVANIPSGDARQAVARLMLACIKAARADAGEAEGDTSIGAVEETPYGQAVTANFQVYRTFVRTEQGLIL
jgi:hypothetical protein